MATTTFQALLKEYLFGGYIPVRYWQRYKEELWLHHGLKPWPGLRERALAKEKKRHAFYQKQQFKEMISRPSALLGLIQKDDHWTGGCLIVPFKGRQSYPVVFNKPNPGPYERD